MPPGVGADSERPLSASGNAWAPSGSCHASPPPAPQALVAPPASGRGSGLCHAPGRGGLGGAAAAEPHAPWDGHAGAAAGGGPGAAAAFFDQMKSRTKGYASMEYHLIGYRKNELETQGMNPPSAVQDSDSGGDWQPGDGQ